MIYSSADILDKLGSGAIIRQECRLKIVDGRPGLGVGEYTYIYVDKYPTVTDFEATWKIWIQVGDESIIDLVKQEIASLLPNFDFEGPHYSTTDFRTERTEVRPSASVSDVIQDQQRALQQRLEGLEKRGREALDGRDGKDGLDGLPGRDGKDGRDGVDGRDGKDLVATEAELFDLQDVEQGIQMERGQVLTWDGAKWTNLFVRQTMSAGGSAVSTTATDGGGAGVSSTIGWTYHPHDHTEEPNSGHFHTDSADGELVTVFHVSNETSRGNDVEVLLRDLLVQGYDRIYVALGEDLSQAHLYTITGYTETVGGFEINVTHVETAGLEPDYQNAKLYEFLFTKSAPAPGSVDNVTIVSETAPTLRDNGDALIQGDSWYLPSTDQLYLWIDGAWEEIKDNGGIGGVLNSFWKFKDNESAGWDDGKFRVNSHQNKTDWSLTTEIYIAYKNDDGNNTKNYILQLIKPGQYVYIQRKDRPDAFAIFEVQAVPVDADAKGATISVSFVTQGPDISDITNDKLCGITFSLVTSGGGGSTTLAGLTDTNTSGATEGDLLVYRSGIWTSEVAPATGLQSGDNVSELVNDAGYITSAEAPVQPGDLFSGSYDDLTDKPFIPSNTSDLVNDSGFITAGDIPAAPVTSVAGKTGDVTLVKADITDFNEGDYATAAQGALADTALQPGDNISELVNDAGYLTQIPGTLFTGRYRYESNTTLAPGASVVRFNSTAYASVTQIAFSKIDRDGRDTNEFLNDIVQPGFTVYFEQQNDPTRSVKFEITSFGSNNPGNVIWNVRLVSDTGVSLQTNNDVVTQFESAPVAVGVEEAPQDGNYYVRQNGAWVNLQTALDAMGLTIDGGTAS